MKKLMKQFMILTTMVVMAFVLTSCLDLTRVAHAVELEKFILDGSTPIGGLHTFNGIKDPHNWNLNANIKASLFEIPKTGTAIGIEARPVWDINGSVLTANYGVFIRPAKLAGMGIELHADRTNDLPLNRLTRSSIFGNGETIAGVRLVFRDR